MILITGANGWLGYNLVELIINNKTEKWGLKKNKIIAFVYKGTNIEKLKKFNKNDLEIIEGDLNNKFELNRFLLKGNSSTLIHTVGMIHPTFTGEFYNINYKIVQNILLNLKNYSIKKTIIISSNSVAGFNSNHKSPFDENSSFNPYLSYGKSKKMMELEVEKYFDEINITIIRAPWFYGKNQPLRQKKFFDMILKNKFPIIGNGENLRSMVYIDNLVQGISLAASKSISKGKVYWIADKQPNTMNYIINTVKEIFSNEFNKKISRKNRHYPNIISSLARFFDKYIQKIGFYNTQIHVLGELNMNIFCSTTKAENELGYLPEFSLYEGMKKSMKEIYD